MSSKKYNLSHLEKLTNLTGTQIKTITNLIDTLNDSDSLPLLDNMMSIQNVVLNSLELLTVTTAILNQELADLYEIEYSQQTGLLNQPDLIVHSLNVKNLDEDYEDLESMGGVIEEDDDEDDDDDDDDDDPLRT